MLVAVLLILVGVGMVVGGNAGKTNAETEARISRYSSQITASVFGGPSGSSDAETTGWWILIGAGVAVGVGGVIVGAVALRGDSS